MITAAARQRQRRLREKAGLIVLPVVCDEHGLADALAASNRLTLDETTDRSLLAAAAGRVLAEFIRQHTASRVTVATSRTDVPIDHDVQEIPARTEADARWRRRRCS